MEKLQLIDNIDASLHKAALMLDQAHEKVTLQVPIEADRAYECELLVEMAIECVGKALEDHKSLRELMEG